MENSFMFGVFFSYVSFFNELQNNENVVLVIFFH